MKNSNLQKAIKAFKECATSGIWRIEYNSPKSGTGYAVSYYGTDHSDWSVDHRAFVFFPSLGPGSTYSTIKLKNAAEKFKIVGSEPVSWDNGVIVKFLEDYYVEFKRLPYNNAVTE